jgi:GNAT superfamily N-acetyltransferase
MSVPFGELEIGAGRLRELGRSGADLAGLQALLERTGDYFRLHEDREPAPAEARELWDELPPGTPAGAKHIVGLFAPGLEGIAEIVRDWPRSGTWNIGLLLLDPAARGGGTGAQTVAAIDAWAARSGADRLRISVIAANARGLRFWRRLGFEAVPAASAAAGAQKPVTAFERSVHSRP